MKRRNAGLVRCSGWFGAGYPRTKPQSTHPPTNLVRVNAAGAGLLVESRITHVERERDLRHGPNAEQTTASGLAAGGEVLLTHASPQRPKRPSSACTADQSNPLGRVD